LPLKDERYDFVIPRSSLEKPSVQAFRDLLRQEETRKALASIGFPT
jgi:molybdate-binding protein